ncbi:Borealin N terminal-domain-containing protein [Bombardia bombarda]|uniref:Borealin N terminal-domain-containing protein n=1 Tax=Bombardia bombarda TaxID=252184 RepID=A0AA39TZU8_9PEZI|nr:Borealin N terminal-domain-containing protein [Bombardia bombarda]
MAPPNEVQNTLEMAAQIVPTKTGSPSEALSSPSRKRKPGITLAQKQALVDNLQLEITERARKLRANCNIHAQSLRTRVEIRVNRIPLSLRKAKMGDLLQKYLADEQQQQKAIGSRGPPVPEKDAATGRLVPYRAPASIARPAKRLSHEISGGDKENEVEASIENPKKKARGGGGPAADMMRNPAQILSPTSSNSRIPPREREPRPTEPSRPPISTPGRSGIARPVSPTKPTSMLSNMVEKARGAAAAATTASSRTAAAAASKTAQKTIASTTTTTTTSSNSDAKTATTATRTRRAQTTTERAPPPPPHQNSRPATRTAQRRASGTSESSEGSTSTVVRKRPGTAMSTASSTTRRAAVPKRTVMGTMKKGVAASTAKKAAAAAPAKAAAPASTTSTGRVLRKRGA